MIWLFHFVLRLLMILILLRVALSWLDPRRESELSRLLRFLTEPVLAPFRRLFYARGARLDFSPVAALICLELLRGLVDWLLARGA